MNWPTASVYLGVLAFLGWVAWLIFREGQTIEYGNHGRQKPTDPPPMKVGQGCYVKPQPGTMPSPPPPRLNK